MTLSATFPNERQIIDDMEKFKEVIRPEILSLIREKKPLPENTEIQNRITGEWENLSSVALEAANRQGLFTIDPCAWHYSWRDIWPRLRIK
jgi:hypothetical protein